MTTQFDRELYGFRFANTERGDTLQVLAARELGDASRWPELISYNKLVPPFITDDPELAGPGVVLTGRQILVPAPSPVVTTTTDPDAVFEKDIRLSSDGQILVEGGDFAVVSGAANLVQSVKNRVQTERGELIYHPEYGSNVRRMIGVVNGPTAGLLASQYAKSAVQSDPRINRVTNASASVDGDVVSVTVEAEAIAGRIIEITVAP